MAGDHKCPVCQATFTRPQHVARHMRSHTGDRPYKCQYCGDQFARSDLLSRHVNKCHANEKPLPSTGARRKGATSATRATTSKQACDQCVQSSLPCDGSNPCTKCVSRKSRCTYIKFHRQTAPVGPGHNLRLNAPTSSALTGTLPPPSSLTASTASSSRLPLYHHQVDDDFILGPAPSVPTMAETLYQSNSFAFPPLYPHNDVTGMPDGTADYASKYRAQQAELFGPGRSGLGTGLTPLYDPRPGSSTSSSSWMSGWDGQDSHESYQPQAHTRQTDYVSASASSASALHDKPLPTSLNQAGNASSHYITGSNPQNLDGNSSQAGNPLSVSLPYSSGYSLPGIHGSSSPPSQNHTRNSSTSYGSSSRRGSGDFSNDGTSVSGSIPNSASTSNPHLPLPGTTIGFGNTTFNLGSIPNKHSHATGAAQGQQSYDPRDDRQDFHSVFGLMSLDDPAVMAGVAADGQPFFSDPTQVHNQNPEQHHDGLLTTDVGADLDTPMPLKRDAGQLHMPPTQRPSTSHGAPSHYTQQGAGALPTPSKDTEAKELKDFWREYLRTPLTGPQDSGLAANVSSSPSKLTPNGFRRQRVSSLPSAKTPMVEKTSFMPAAGYGHVDPRGRDAGPTSSLRTTLHGKEDLRSYEAAVMARKAPTTLNLQLKKPVKSKSSPHPNQMQLARTDSRSTNESHSSSTSPQMGYNSRPSSSAGPEHGIRHRASTSSLANAFAGRPSFSDESPPSLTNSRDTSVDSDTASDAEVRPSFKRLPSQTLGPDSSKRAFLGYEDDLGERQRSAGWMTGAPEIKPLNLGGMSGMSHPDRVVASIADRRRRMSAPGGSPERVQRPSSDSPPNVPALGFAPSNQG